MIVNGKEYPMWSQFVERKQEWIGGLMRDTGSNMDRSFGLKPMTTEIMDIELVPNGENSAFFRVKGKDFSCGFDVSVGGVSGNGEDKEWLSFRGYGGHRWAIKRPASTTN